MVEEIKSRKVDIDFDSPDWHEQWFLAGLNNILAGLEKEDNRLFVEAVLYRYRAGIAWRDLPERFGNFRSIHTRHTRWSRNGTWRKVFETLAQDADNEYAMIDSTIVRAHQHSAGARKKGGRNPKTPEQAKP